MSSTSSPLPVRPQLLQIQVVTFILLHGSALPKWPHTAGQTTSGMTTGLEANSGKESEPPFRLTVAVAHILFIIHQLQVLVARQQDLQLTESSESINQESLCSPG